MIHSKVLTISQPDSLLLRAFCISLRYIFAQKHSIKTSGYMADSAAPLARCCAIDSAVGFLRFSPPPPAQQLSR